MITIEKIDGKPGGGMSFDVPPEFAGAFNLMAHPTAALAAASAIGLGFASQAMGLWFGAVAGAMEAALQLHGGGDDASRSRAPAPAGSRLRVVRPVRNDPGSATGAGRDSNVVAMPRPARAGAAATAQPSGIGKPARPDDLKAIGGIGPKLEKVLNGLGVWTYAQIADWTPAQAAWVDDKLGFAGRIGRDDWIGQAARLAQAK